MITSTSGREPEQASGFHHSEDAKVYRDNASFVYSDKYTSAVLKLLDAQPGDAILDLGCGSGELTRGLASLVGNQGSVLGLDASSDMLDAARKDHYDDHARSNLRYDLADGCRLAAYLEKEGLQSTFDKVFSNAALHWMKESPASVIEAIHLALKEQGVFAAEFGGFMNITGIRGGLHQALRKRGIDAEGVDPWFFPTPEAYAALLMAPALAPAFQVLSIELVPRPTPLPTGLRGWLSSFGGPFFNAIPHMDREEVVKELEELLRPDMFDPATQSWSAMYTRLRVKAIKGPTQAVYPLILPSQVTPSDSIAIDPDLVKKFGAVSPASAGSKEAASRIQSDFINQTVRITIPDGRIFEGTFLCVDDGLNAILSQANELRTDESGAESSRFVGMVMIKGTDVVRVAVKVGSSPAATLGDRVGGGRQAGQMGSWPTDPAAYT